MPSIKKRLVFLSSGCLESFGTLIFLMIGAPIGWDNSNWYAGITWIVTLRQTKQRNFRNTAYPQMVRAVAVNSINAQPLIGAVEDNRRQVGWNHRHLEAYTGRGETS